MRKQFILNNVGLGGRLIKVPFNLECNKFGIPLNKYWRDRLKDGKVDDNMVAYTKPKSKAKVNRSTRK